MLCIPRRRVLYYTKGSCLALLVMTLSTCASAVAQPKEFRVSCFVCTGLTFQELQRGLSRAIAHRHHNHYRRLLVWCLSYVTRVCFLLLPSSLAPFFLSEQMRWITTAGVLAAATASTLTAGYVILPPDHSLVPASITGLDSTASASGPRGGLQLADGLVQRTKEHPDDGAKQVMEIRLRRKGGKGKGKEFPNKVGQL